VRSRNRVIAALAASTVIALVTTIVALPVLSEGPMYTRRERLGFAFVTHLDLPGGYVQQSLNDYAIAPLGAGWYSDWSYGAAPAMPADGDVEYAQLVRVADASWPPNWTAIQNVASLSPGALWLIGNEPECPNQDAVTPDLYAARYDEACTRLKGWDPTAQIAIGAIVEPTPLRFRWLEKVLASYQQQFGTPMPVDVWNIHIQILSEGADTADGYDNLAGGGVPVGIDPVAEGLTPRQYSLQDCANPQILENMVWDFREWMNVHGQREKPLIISEMGVVQPSEYLADGATVEERTALGDRLVEDFIVEVNTFLMTETDSAVGCPDDENRLVQRWLWFALNTQFFWDNQGMPHGFNGGLYDPISKQPTRFGVRFMASNHLNRVSVPFVTR